MTTSLPAPNVGDVVILPFVFLDGQGVKRRPAVVLSSQSYNQSRDTFIFSPITGSSGSSGDSYVVEITDLGHAGLSKRSYCHGIIFAAKNGDIVRIAGYLTSGDRTKLRKLFGDMLLI